MTTATRTALKWEYAPAPESRDVAALRASPWPCHSFEKSSARP